MIKIYVPNLNKDNIGGGFSFIRNFRKALKHDIEFVDHWDKCDIYFIFGITTIADKSEIYEAVKAGKKLVLRIDNIPRRSRNKRMSPAERLTEFGGMAHAVIYQSQWCMNYAGYFIKNDNEFIVNNGVDAEIFNTKGRESDGNTYLYINYNDNPNKRFDEALYWFDMAWRDNNNNHLWIAGVAPKIYLEHPEYNWDLPSNGKVEYVGIMKTPEDVANLMKKCDYLLYPSFCEAYPNTLLEAMACGVKPIHLCDEGGAKEVYNNNQIAEDDTFPLKWKYKVKTIQEMGQEYLNIFNKVVKK